MPPRDPDDDLSQLLDELGDCTFDRTARAITQFDDDPSLDPRLETFIADYARLCAEMFHAGFVPALDDEPPFIVQAVRALDLEERNQARSFREARRATTGKRAEDGGPEAPRGRRPVRPKRR
ncbi:MAG: hypothetical protein IPJ65_13595 [Archangiaceae bacterium]|nr:hypothetical protein [Archangiaceae bacterium]